MKVLFIEVDVSHLSEEELEELMDQTSSSIAEFQGEILAFKSATVDETTGEVLDEDPSEPDEDPHYPRLPASGQVQHPPLPHEEHRRRFGSPRLLRGSTREARLGF